MDKPKPDPFYQYEALVDRWSSLESNLDQVFDKDSDELDHMAEESALLYFASRLREAAILNVGTLETLRISSPSDWSASCEAELAQWQEIAKALNNSPEVLSSLKTGSIENRIRNMRVNLASK